jgi:hypothetical protein
MSRRTVNATPRMLAELKGESTYLGSPCSNCGCVRRFVASGNCVKSHTHERSKAARKIRDQRNRERIRANSRLWKKANPEKVRELYKKYKRRKTAPARKEKLLLKLETLENQMQEVKQALQELDLILN